MLLEEMGIVTGSQSRAWPVQAPLKLQLWHLHACFKTYSNMNESINIFMFFKVTYFSHLNRIHTTIMGKKHKNMCLDSKMLCMELLQRLLGDIFKLII